MATGALITAVECSSPASRAGIRRGDRVYSCNGYGVSDWVDILLATSGNTLSVSLGRGLSKRNITLRRNPGASWGISVEGSEPRKCRNSCLFCFVDQQPPGLRNSLMVKDDDIRYSFLHGTYVTLTRRQVEEAVERGFTSVHVSVHATDPWVRGRLLGLSGPLPVLPGIACLESHGISVEAQIVSVPGINDGNVLRASMEDLYACGNVSALGVVPVGLTRWRMGLPRLERPTRSAAEETIELVEDMQGRAMKERGTRWVFAADEYYILAGRRFPPAGAYEAQSLRANGIGLMPAALLECRGRVFLGEGLAVTGTLAASALGEIFEGTGYRVLPVENRLMGPMVGVAGLLCARDVIETVSRCDLAAPGLFLPSAMFNHDGLTLDDCTASGIGEVLGMNVVVADSPGDLP